MNVLRLRPATPEDHPTFARLFDELGIDDPVPDVERFARDFAPATWIATRGDEPVGYTFIQVLKGVGYVRHIVVDPSARRGGVGRFVLSEVARHFRDAGCTRWCLNVKPENAAARGLYEALGMREVYGAHVVRIPWASAERLPGSEGGAAPPAAEPLAAELEPAFEVAFGLPLGLLAARPASKTVLGVRSAAGEPLGVASFDAGFPGAFPFRARSAAVARALIDACRALRVPIVDPDRPWRETDLQLFVEDDEALVGSLLAVGGTVPLTTLHYRGDLGGAPA